MRVVLDTNILISALLIQVGHPAAIYRAWQNQGTGHLLTSTNYGACRSKHHTSAPS